MAPLATIMLNQNKSNINKWYKVTLNEATPMVLAILYLAAAAGAATARIHVNNAASALAGFYRAGRTHHRCGCRRQLGRLWGSFHLLGTHGAGRKDLDIAWPDALKGTLSYVMFG